MDDEDWSRAIVYRRAYGLARRRVEEDGMRPARPDPGELLKRLVEHVAREMPGHGWGEAIEDGVRDAIEGRQPRW